MTHRRREGQGGFALLMVFVMAAGIALMLYNQLPRTAFESMRGKEELLVDHANQYERAIQLYVAKFQKYPAALDDLEKTNNVRFLRRRFKNPFTGKDDWRLIHVDNMGKLTDSLVQKKEEKKPNQNTFITEMAGIGQTPNLGDDAGVNVALRKRPSEGGDAAGGQAPLPMPSSGYQPLPQPGQPQFQQPTQQQQPIPNPVVDATAAAAQQQQQMQQQQLIQQMQQQGMTPAQIQAQLTQMQAQSQLPPVQVNPNNPNMNQIYPNGVPQFAGQPNPAVNPQTGMRYPGGQIPGQPPNPYGQPQQPPNPYGQPQQQQQNPFGQPAPPPPSTYPTQPSTGTPGTPSFGNNTPNAALDSIRQALTSPSPNMPMNLAPGLQIMGGLAGIAPKNEGPSIRIINEQTNYKKWEFVYDMKKDSRMKQALGAQQNQMNRSQQGMQNGMQNGMQGGTGPQNPFGNAQPVGYGPGSPTTGQQPIQPQQPSQGFPNPFGGRR